jgi:hypothetical protein
MRWFGNQHIFELGWRGVYIAGNASCDNVLFSGHSFCDPLQ